MKNCFVLKIDRTVKITIKNGEGSAYKTAIRGEMRVRCASVCNKKYHYIFSKGIGRKKVSCALCVMTLCSAFKMLIMC